MCYRKRTHCYVSGLKYCSQTNVQGYGSINGNTRNHVYTAT